MTIITTLKSHFQINFVWFNASNSMQEVYFGAFLTNLLQTKV